MNNFATLLTAVLSIFLIIIFMKFNLPRRIRIFFVKIMRFPQMLKFLRLKDDIQQQVEIEPVGPQRDAMIKRYNGIIEQKNKQADGVTDMIRAKMKKNAKAFDLAMFKAAKSSRRYMHYRNMATEYDLDPTFYINNKAHVKGYKTIKLRKVRKNFVSLGIDYENLTTNNIYEKMTELWKEKRHDDQIKERGTR